MGDPLTPLETFHDERGGLAFMVHQLSDNEFRVRVTDFRADPKPVDVGVAFPTQEAARADARRSAGYVDECPVCGHA